MAKDTFYFSHDSNARNDEKIIALRIKYDWKGYGIFWAMIEKMRESTNYMCIKDYNIIAFDLRIDAAIVKSIVEDFGLFVFTECGKYFYSERLMANMEHVQSKSKKAKENANLRWEKEKQKSDSNANAMQTHSDSNAKKRKESKVKEKKERVELSPHTHTDVEIDLFKKFEQWLNKHAPRVQQLKEPLTIDEYFKLKKEIPKETLTNVLMAMQNRADLLKKYVSANLTIRNWSKRENNNPNDTNDNEQKRLEREKAEARTAALANG